MNHLPTQLAALGLVELTALIAASTAIVVKILDCLVDLVKLWRTKRKNRKEVNNQC